MNTSEIKIANASHIHELVQQLHEQAYETEQKQLDNTSVTKAIEFLIENSHFGFFIIYLENQRIFGQILMTKEYNIYSGLTLWFQSVYVKKERRQKGIFKKLYKEFAQYAQKEKAPMKLYVETENKVAIKVYEKLGMIRTEETIFEDDFVFHPIKIINLGMDCVTKVSNNSKELEELFKRGKSIMENDLTKPLQFDYCLNNNRNPFLITYHHDYYLIGLYFIEFSDWRNGLIIWFYDFVSSTYNNGIIGLMLSDMLNTVKQKLVKFNPDLKGIRILVDRAKGNRLEQLLEVVGMKESHYYIYYKNYN